MRDLGYCNSWYAPYILKDGIWVKKFPDKVPEAVLKCRELGHLLTENNLDDTNHGYNTVTSCKVCGYCYHTDSSD